MGKDMPSGCLLGSILVTHDGNVTPLEHLSLKPNERGKWQQKVVAFTAAIDVILVPISIKMRAPRGKMGETVECLSESHRWFRPG